MIWTGVSYSPDTTGVVIYENGVYAYYEHIKFPVTCHGTGDIYASSFVGALMRGNSIFESAKKAADYTVRCIEYTRDDPQHWYGVKFEPVLSELMKML